MIFFDSRSGQRYRACNHSTFPTCRAETTNPFTLSLRFKRIESFLSYVIVIRIDGKDSIGSKLSYKLQLLMRSHANRGILRQWLESDNRTNLSDQLRPTMRVENQRKHPRLRSEHFSRAYHSGDVDAAIFSTLSSSSESMTSITLFGVLL